MTDLELHSQVDGIPLDSNDINGLGYIQKENKENNYDN